MGPQYGLDDFANAVDGKILMSIAVTPALPSVAALATQQMTATGTYKDGSTAVLTKQCLWASSDTGKATVLATYAAATCGLVTGVATGTTTVSAAFGGVSGSTVVTVPA